MSAEARTTFLQLETSLKTTLCERIADSFMIQNESLTAQLTMVGAGQYPMTSDCMLEVACNKICNKALVFGSAICLVYKKCNTFVDKYSS